MTDTDNTIYGIFKNTLAHSSDQVFAIFSGILVISSLQTKSCTLILVGFLTLIYALIAHRLTALRKHEELGDYAAGKDNIQIKLFTTIYHLYFVWWSTGVAIILLDAYYPKFEHLLPYTPFQINIDLLKNTHVFVLAVNIVLTIGWFCNLFYKKCREENKWKKEYDKENKDSRTPNGYYDVELFCKNCGKEKIKENIPKGVKFENHRCPKCKVKALARKKEIVNDLSIKIEILKK